MRESTSSILSGVRAALVVNFLPSSLRDKVLEIYQIPALKSVKKDKKCVFVCWLTFLRCINCNVICFINYPTLPLVRHFVWALNRCVKTQRKRLTTRPGVLLCVSVKETVFGITEPLWLRTRVLLPAAKKEALLPAWFAEFDSQPVCVNVVARGFAYVICDLRLCIRPPLLVELYRSFIS